MNKWFFSVLASMSLIALPALADERKPVISRVIEGAFTAVEQIIPGGDNEYMVYGKVNNIDLDRYTLEIYYFDAFSNKGKAIEVFLTSITEFRDGVSPEDIKKGSLLSVSYAVHRGKNIARKIVLDKETDKPGPLNDFFDFEPDDAIRYYKE